MDARESMNEQKNDDKLCDNDNFFPLFNFGKKEIGVTKACEHTRVYKYREKVVSLCILSLDRR